MTTITGTLLNAGGAGVSGVTVSARLVAAAELLTAGGQVIRSATTTSASPTGAWTLTLTPISALAYPTGAYYTVEADGRRWHITVPDTGSHELATVLVTPPADREATGLTQGTADSRYEQLTRKGQASGYASLDSDGKVPTAQLPATSVGVASVNGQTGTVALAAADVGASAVGHTHPAADIASGTLAYARLPVLAYRGAWDSGTAYNIGDITTMAAFSASFGAKTAHTNQVPVTEFAFLTVPALDDPADGAAYTMGWRFAVVGGPIRTKAIEFYKAAANGGTHIGRLWNDDTDTLIEAVTFSGETASGLQSMPLVRVLPVGSYVCTVDMPSGNYLRTLNFFTAAVARSRVVAPINAGGFASSLATMPDTFGSTSYGVSLRWEEYNTTDWSIVGRY